MAQQSKATGKATAEVAEAEAAQSAAEGSQAPPTEEELRQREIERFIRKGREGSRWYNVRPDGSMVSEWFLGNVPMHDGLLPSDYVGGVTLIQSKDKAEEVIGFGPKGRPVFEEITHIVYTPYPKVDMRVKYWNDYLALHKDEWMGVLKPVPAESPDRSLPEGFFWMNAGVGDKQEAFICCTMKATIYLRSTIKYEKVTVDKRTGEQKIVMTGETILDAPPATKMVSVINRWNKPDPFSVMKAETGAVGRALGMAGMLIVPGAGVATAEDLIEQQQINSGENIDGGGTTAQLPTVAAALPAVTRSQDNRGQEDIDADLRLQAEGLIPKLRALGDEPYEEFTEWCKSRSIGRLSETNSPALKGMVKKLETLIDKAEK